MNQAEREGGNGLQLLAGLKNKMGKPNRLKIRFVMETAC